LFSLLTDTDNLFVVLVLVAENLLLNWTKWNVEFTAPVSSFLIRSLKGVDERAKPGSDAFRCRAGCSREKCRRRHPSRRRTSVRWVAESASSSSADLSNGPWSLPSPSPWPPPKIDPLTWNSKNLAEKNYLICQRGAKPWKSLATVFAIIFTKKLEMSS